MDPIDEPTSIVWRSPRRQVAPKSGISVGAVEVQVPRGILYHCYKFDNKVRITNCDGVIPTIQNHANIQHDLSELAAQYTSYEADDRTIELLTQMLVRSYDPYILCSVH
jgi:sulfhydrogenase subunit alpha